MRNLKRKSSVLSLILLLSLAVAAQGSGQNKGLQKGKKQGSQQCTKQNKGEKMAQYLELSDDQKSKIEDLKLNHQKEMLPLRNELGEKKAKMRSLKTANPADIKAINSLIDEMAVVKTKMAKDRAAMHQEIRKVLNDEQRIKFDMHAGKKGGKGQGKGYGHGHGKRCAN